MSLTMPYARAGVFNTKTQETCYEEQEIEALSNFKRECDRTTLDLTTYKAAFEALKNKTNCPNEWWQTPQAITVFIFLAGATGIIIGNRR